MGSRGRGWWGQGDGRLGVVGGQGSRGGRVGVVGVGGS